MSAYASLSPSGSANTPRKESPGNDSESSGFRSFWKSSGKSGSQSNVTFVQQDPAPKKSSKIGRIFKHGSNAPAATGSSEEKTKPKKRRQQVYQAQKRHRNRKAEYVRSLEAEIARLQQADSLAHSQKNSLAHENQKMRKLLSTHSVDFQLSNLSFAAPSSEGDLSMLGAADIEIRFDPDIGHERTFLDFNEMDWTTSSSSVKDSSLSASATPPAPSTSSSATPMKQEAMGDSWAAVDFILALEWPCQGHTTHTHINPTAKAMVVDEELGVHGHALTATASVFQSALPPSSPASEPKSPQHLNVPGTKQPAAEARWQLPYTEIEKLINMSENLPLDEEEMTPAQAYSAIRKVSSSKEDLQATLEALKVDLGAIVCCKGFGTVLQAHAFWQRLDSAIQKLKLQA